MDDRSAPDGLGPLLRGFDRAWLVGGSGLAADGSTRSGVRRISAGDDVREQLTRLIADEYGALVGVAHGRMRAARADAEDVVQQTALKLWRSPPRMRDPDKLREYVYTALHNQTNTWFTRTAAERGHRAPPPRPDDDAAPEPADPAPPFDGLVVQHMLVSLALSALPRRELELVELYYLDGHPLAVAAERLGISEGAAKRYLHDARARLRADRGIASLMPAA